MRSAEKSRNAKALYPLTQKQRLGADDRCKCLALQGLSETAGIPDWYVEDFGQGMKGQ